MDRKKLYNQITSLGLQNEVKTTYGKNYTQCTNAQLAAVVSGATKIFEDAVKVIPTKVESNSFQKLVEILQRKKILLNSEVDIIMNA